ncbi:unnamed protein product [marine sediment metagenome]|uniref:Uncharacterized protein n=1 Tax=marine sediment metagenome TaxID=412755 RepID=X1SV80_9ZZZZ
MAFSKLEKAMALIIGLDIAAPGFSRGSAKMAIRAIAPLASRAGIAGTGLISANPVAAGVGLGGLALASPPGQQLLSDVSDIGRRDRIALENAIAQLTQVTLPKAVKRKKSKFNQMVSSGMKTLKASTSYGKKGSISNSKKAFAKVTTTASKILKGGKTAKSGITRKLGLAMRRFI